MNHDQLRDYFAGLAMQAIRGNYPHEVLKWEDLAIDAYEIAKTMMKVRHEIISEEREIEDSELPI